MALPFRAEACGGGVVGVRLVQLHHRARGTVYQCDQLWERVAEEAGDAQRDVHTWAAQHAHRQDFKARDTAVGGVPFRFAPHQRQGLRDVVAAGAHVGRAPSVQQLGAWPVAVGLQVFFN